MELAYQVIKDLSSPAMVVVGFLILREIHLLNTKIAVIIERVDHHEKRISHLEENK